MSWVGAAVVRAMPEASVSVTFAAMQINKAVIPAAGLGTRMLPAAKAVPKELLPLIDRPTLQYVVEEAAGAGIADVLLISGQQKRAIEDHFDRNPELQQRLAAGGKQSLLASIDELMQHVQVHSVRQSQQLGLGHAVLQARRHVGDQPFLCLLGDTIFTGQPQPAAQLVAAAQRLGASVIGLEMVAAEKVGRYGIVSGSEVAPGVVKVNALVEKPKPQEAPSRLAICARYVLTPRIFDCLQRTAPGAGGEIQLTDALRLLLEHEPVYGVLLEATRHDIGNPVDWLKTNLVLARRDPQLWQQLRPLLVELMK
jgi:UTP--glucose-1-phosphate uridylyltransferase